MTRIEEGLSKIRMLLLVLFGRLSPCIHTLNIALLPDQLHFECVEFWIRQATEEIDTMGDLGCNLKKEMPYLLWRAGETKRIRRMPMGNNGLTWPDRSRLSGLVADGNYEIKMLVLKLGPELAPGITRVNPEIFPEQSGASSGVPARLDANRRCKPGNGHLPSGEKCTQRKCFSRNYCCKE